MATKEGMEEGGKEERMVLVCWGPEGHLWVARRVLVGGRSKGCTREPMDYFCHCLSKN